MRTTASLGDKQVAQVTQRGTAVVLSLMQEETTDIESGFVIPAKSFTVDQLEGLKSLRDLLNATIPPEGGAL